MFHRPKAVGRVVGDAATAPHPRAAERALVLAYAEAE